MSWLFSRALVETALWQENLSDYRASEEELGKREVLRLLVQAH